MDCMAERESAAPIGYLFVATLEKLGAISFLPQPFPH